MRVTIEAWGIWETGWLGERLLERATGGASGATWQPCLQHGRLGLRAELAVEREVWTR